MLQLNPMIPVYSEKHNQNGYAFLVIDYSQEHYLFFAVALDNGEIWVLSNRDIRFQANESLHRKKEQKYEVEIKNMPPFDPNVVFKQKEDAPIKEKMDKVTRKEHEEMQEKLAEWLKKTLVSSPITTSSEPRMLTDLEAKCLEAIAAIGHPRFQDSSHPPVYASSAPEQMKADFAEMQELQAKKRKEWESRLKETSFKEKENATTNKRGSY